MSGRLSGKPRKGSGPRVTFAAFDVLWLDGQLLIDERMRSAAALSKGSSLGDNFAVVPRFAACDLDDLLTACEKQDLEGVVLKRLGSRYRPGERSRDWRKVKCRGWREHLQRRVSGR